MLVHRLQPVFMATTLGVSKSLIGLIEGVAEAIAQILKLFAGVGSDWSGRRAPFVFAGYGLSALTKPLFPLAGTVWLVAVARFSDRIGKGIRDSPRDALLADTTPKEMRGAAYGLRQSLDTTGAVPGPLVAAGLLIVLGGEGRPSAPDSTRSAIRRMCRRRAAAVSSSRPGTRRGCPPLDSAGFEGIVINVCRYLRHSALQPGLASAGPLPTTERESSAEECLPPPRGSQEAPMASKLFVGGLPSSTTSEGLREPFAQCGTVVSAAVITDRFSGQSCGFGFVEMSTEAEAQAAIGKLNGQPYGGRRLTVNIANPLGGSRPTGTRLGGARGAARRPVRW